jgi:hypothetical protein
MRLDQAVLLELPDESGRRAGALAELAGVDLLFGVGERRGSPAALRLARSGRGQLLADDPQRQELVALEAQDRLQTLDVVLVEEAVAAFRALRLQQALFRPRAPPTRSGGG